MTTKNVNSYWLGRVDYEAVYNLQARLVNKRLRKEIDDTVLFLEHDPVYTFGKYSSRENLLLSDEEAETRGIKIFHSNRGGDVFYHGPGQLVIYSIMNIKEECPEKDDVIKYLKKLERVIIKVAESYGITAGSRSEMFGAWADLDSLAKWDCDFPSRPAKFGSIGSRTDNFVTSHGCAINVLPITEEFSLFNSTCYPFGDPKTSLFELGASIPDENPVRQVANVAEACYAEIFDATVVRLGVPAEWNL